MSFLAALPIIGDFFEGLFGVIDKAVLDKDEANKLKSQIETIVQNGDIKKFEADMEARSKIVIAEAQGKSALQRNWRPILMLSIVAIVVNNYILFPYLSMFTDKVVILELPNALFNLMTVGVGGYIVGRSGEKIIDKYKDK